MTKLPMPKVDACQLQISFQSVITIIGSRAKATQIPTNKQIKIDSTKKTKSLWNFFFLWICRWFTHTIYSKKNITESIRKHLYLHENRHTTFIRNKKEIFFHRSDTHKKSMYQNRCIAIWWLNNDLRRHIKFGWFLSRMFEKMRWIKEKKIRLTTIINARIGRAHNLVQNNNNKTHMTIFSVHITS